MENFKAELCEIFNFMYYNDYQYTIEKF